MKIFKKLLSVVLCLLFVTSMSVLAFAGTEADYKIVSPYEGVIWSGKDAWGAYKGTLHSHTTYSDATVDLATMVKGYYEQDFDFLANADHSVTGVEWNKTPAIQPIYLYQPLLGYKLAHLTDEEFEAITNGTYNNRGKKMVCVTGANELNNLSLTKNHVNGYFLPANVGNGFAGMENEIGYEQAIEFIDKNDGLSHINHPGDWMQSNSNPEAVNDPYNIQFFGDLILKYDSCLGTEVLNEDNGATGYDRVFWDNLLMYCLPYGKNVLGFANTDAHDLDNIDTSYMVFMMKENNVANITETMQSGAFFSITRSLRDCDFEIGPAERIDASNTDTPYPLFTSVTVDGHNITVTAKDATEIQFIGNGKVLKSQPIGTEAVTLNLDTVEKVKVEDLLYVRVEIKGEGGMCLTQPLVIDNGSEPLVFTEETTVESFFNELSLYFKATKIWTLICELIALF